MKKFFLALNIILSLALAAGLGYLAVARFSDYKTSTSVLNFILLLAVGLPVATVFHEIGHMLFGAVVKIRAVPDIEFIKPSSCKIIPKTDKGLKSRIIFTTLGGLFMNVLLIALGVLAFFVRGIPAEVSAFIPTSFYILFLNALPFEYSGGKSDGLVICELAREEDAAKVMLAVLTVQAQVLKGKPFSEIDENLLFGVPQIREDDLNFIALTNLRYEYFKAKGDEEEAKKYKDRYDGLKDMYL